MSKQAETLNENENELPLQTHFHVNRSQFDINDFAPRNAETKVQGCRK